jgi:hypothetical protein
MNDDEGLLTEDMSVIDAQVNYVMKDYFAKLSLGFTATNLGEGADGEDIKGNAVQFGFQIQQ